MILLTNDDGISAPALMPLKKSLERLDEVVVLAPDRNWSASGHPKTMHKPLRVDPTTLPDGSAGYKSTGAPPDCVAVALLGFLGKRPDIVVSGINIGPNLGYDILYSGTVAAAVEAIIDGVPAIALSMDSWDTPEDYTPYADFTARVAEQVMSRGLPRDTFLNVNFPRPPWGNVEGMEVTKMGRRVYRDELIRRVDPFGRPYYWLGGEPPEGVPDEGTDIGAVSRNRISITPVHLDMTAYGVIGTIEGWKPGLDL